MTMTYKELLPTRVPEFMHGDNELREYLEVAGELFDEFSIAIKQIDSYKDSELVPEKRLRDLASQFAMNFPRNLDEATQRIILRDLEAIYQKSGTIDIVEWVFRLIGWDVDLEYAWVLNPENYDPNIKEKFKLDDYGREQTPAIMTDFYRRDYRSFVLGEEYVFGNGTYFRGRKFFDLQDTLLKNEIVGEHYDEETKTRTADKAMKTPYLFIRVNEETYNIFISPYVDEETGEVFEYTEAEFFGVVENMFNFFLFDALRPTTVRVVIIVTAQFLEDEGVISDEVTEEWVSEPLDTEDVGIIQDYENSMLFHQPLVGSNFMTGTPPSPFNKDMVISAIGFRNWRTMEDDERQYIDGNERRFMFLNEEDYPVPRCGSDAFRFVTPHEEEFSFNYSISSEKIMNSLDDITKSHTLIVRNPTTITSVNLNGSSKPSDAFDINQTKGQLIGMNFMDGGSLLADTSPKTFWYEHDMTVYYKENNAGDVWQVLVTNPTEDSLNTMTMANTIAFVFHSPINYDFVISVTYEQQTEWENRY